MYEITYYSSFSNSVKCSPPNNILVTVKLNSNKSANFEFSSSITIEQIIIEFVKKYPEEKSKYLNLAYLNIILCPVCTFDMYQIKSGATLYLIPQKKDEITIFVKINSKKIIPLSVKPRCKVDSIKEKLFDFHGIIVDKLIFDNQELDDNKELQYYPITNDSIINAFNNEKQIKLNIHATINIRWNIFDFELLVLPSITISKLKEQIISHLELPKLETTLICNNELLCNDDKTLIDSCIENDDYVEFFAHCAHRVNLRILTSKGKFIDLNPLKTDRIISIKEHIHEKEGFPIDNQKLFLNDIELKDNDSIQAYTKGGELDLICSSDQSIIILIKDGDQIFPIDANQNDSIKSIKDKIMSREKYFIEDQILTFNDQLLNDNQLINDCSISNGSILNLQFDEKCMIQVSIKYSFSRPTDVLNVNKYNKVKHIKKMISELTGFSKKQQRINFNHEILDDFLTLNHYGIINGSTLAFIPKLRG